MEDRIKKVKRFDNLIWVDKKRWNYGHWLLYVEMFTTYISFLHIPTCDPKSVKKLSNRCLIPFKFQKEFLTATCTNTKYKEYEFELFDSSIDWMNYLKYRRKNDPWPVTDIKLEMKHTPGKPGNIYVPDEYQTQELILMSKIL